jgi:hypothetical protein
MTVCAVNRPAVSLLAPLKSSTVNAPDASRVAAAGWIKGTALNFLARKLYSY